MAITSRPQDKYAFLFTGPTAIPRFIKDLENVFDTLTQYYNYPASNITVVLGSTDATPSVPGATVVNITDPTGLETALNAFAGSASGLVPMDTQADPPGGTWKTALLYFTGGGTHDGSVSQLVIDGNPDLAASQKIDPTWLIELPLQRLNAFSNCHVNVVMQQSYAGGFSSALTGSTLNQLSFTSACLAGPIHKQESYGNNTVGSFFTDGWIRGLKLETLPAGTSNPGEYADELVGSTDFLVSLAEAKEFGRQIQDWLGWSALSTPYYYEAGGPQYLGLPAFLIRDGIPPDPWWETPDIYLPSGGNIFIPGANNTINVDVRNQGTHPTRAYSLGIELVDFGIGPTIAMTTVTNHVPSTIPLLPIDIADIGTPADQKDTYPWTVFFPAGTSLVCPKAEARRLHSDVDFSWDIEVDIKAKDFKAWRNLYALVITTPFLPTPFGNLQGFTEQLLAVQNRFGTPRQFIVAFPEDWEELQEILDLKWFVQSADRQSEITPITIIEKPRPHLSFRLRASEVRNLVLRTEMKPEFGVDREVKLPFEILVEGDWPDNARPTALVSHWPNHAPIGGFSIVVRQGGSMVKGKVVNRDNQPVADAKVFLRTANERQQGVLTTNAEGRFESPKINPGVYFIWAEADNWRSDEQAAVLVSDEVAEVKLELTQKQPDRPVKVILDKIRIMNDHDPCIKGKGELTFTSVIVPDNDESAKQVMRLPAEGFYQVSDKPGENELRLEATLFDGLVKNRALSITISGKEIDWFDPDDELNRYHREFSGDPETWYGQYSPTDEYLDREDVGDWALWYRIVRN